MNFRARAIRCLEYAQDVSWHMAPKHVAFAQAYWRQKAATNMVNEYLAQKEV